MEMGLHGVEKQAAELDARVVRGAQMRAMES